MHRDVKLGLALGILVIGFAAAFCFPRQSASDITINPSAGLKLAAVDDDIRLERRRTFVGDELNPPEQPTLAEPVVNGELPPLQTAAMRAQATQRPAPEPIRKDVPLAADEPSVAASSPLPSAPLIETPVEETFYTVQSGDTLSAISSKTLGTSRKYEAIFEANRDVMATPNSLKIGMKLRIPQEAESIAKRPTNGSSPVARSSTTPPGPERIASRDESTSTEPLLNRSKLFSPVGPRSRQASNGDVVPR